MLVGIVIDTKLEHDWKAPLPILVTLVGIVIDISDEHDWNAYCPIRII